ncbi:hypothetical protein CMV_006189 [Castanea mollissima]|uniref:C2 domain-containing protein n=1 Tax=Castanea mollissima TaxID=60419 RepID=A0A8J4RRE7_9ROSI|nr:hypothetical protein CMV_006189 [Castanea mollissima]
MNTPIFGITSISVHRLNLKGNGVSCFSKNQGLRAVVSIPGSDQSVRQKTPIDKNGDTDAMFNFDEHFFTINPNVKQDVVIKLKENRFLCGKDIGQVRLSINELLKSYEKGENQVRCYLAPHGEKLKGELNIMYEFRYQISYTGPGDGDGAVTVGAYHCPTAPESSGGVPPAAAAPPRTSSRFGNVAACIGAVAAVGNALVGCFANCGGINC